MIYNNKTEPFNKIWQKNTQILIIDYLKKNMSVLISKKIIVEPAVVWFGLVCVSGMCEIERVRELSFEIVCWDGVATRQLTPS